MKTDPSTLEVTDWNIENEDGRTPAILTTEQAETVKIGSEVATEDLEGTRCRARVEALTRTSKGVVAWLRPVKWGAPDA